MKLLAIAAVLSGAVLSGCVSKQGIETAEVKLSNGKTVHVVKAELGSCRGAHVSTISWTGDVGSTEHDDACKALINGASRVAGAAVGGLVGGAPTATAMAISNAVAVSN